MRPKHRQHLNEMWGKVNKVRSQISSEHAMHFDLFKTSQQMSYAVGSITEEELVNKLYNKAIQGLKQ